ncbi:MAG: 50S ribosomal protein L9 [Lachnospiraceae bacterium]|nr:50S ribosomal protein L9 [Lachnospiraceae bacterium]
MKIILLKDVKSLGKAGQTVEVSDGYARNFILPKKVGIEANSKNLNDLKLKKAHEDKVAKENLEAAKAFAEDIRDKVINVSIKIGENGKTFGSIATREIAEQAKKQLGFDIDKKKIVLPEPIKTEGVHTVAYKAHPEVTAQLTINVTGERS